MTSPKPFRMRVRVLDGKPHEPNKLKGQLAPHMDVFDARNRTEFVFCVAKEAHLDQIRAKLASFGLEEVPNGDTSVAIPAPRQAETREHQRREPARPPAPRRQAAQASGPGLEKKPYAFVPLPDELTTAPPVWHDGTGAAGRLSGEIRFELVTLRPLLVGWERRQIDDADEPWPIPFTEINGNEVEVHLEGVGRTVRTKSVLCPLRAPWGEKPVLLPGDSIKGLLRHELGALLGAPMERVAERSYSYRPNSLYPNDPNPRLVPRLARIPNGAVVLRNLDPSDLGSPVVRIPTQLNLLPQNLRYDRQRTQNPPRYRFDATGGAPYRGGQGAGVRLNSQRQLHASLEAVPDAPADPQPVRPEVQESYLRTIRHLADLSYGHFSKRHPDIPSSVTGDQARARILEAASSVVFQPGDLIWIEWDTRDERIVSLGWHYYYRWAYTDTVRKPGWALERHGLFPLAAERAVDDEGAPQGLSPVRRLFGYTRDNENEGSRGIGKDDHEQLMGRISVNAAIEVIEDGDTPQKRFLPPTFLRELGMPRPSAVEHYLKQPYYSQQRPSDRAKLVTYGDAPGYDEPGKLAGRKFYLDRADAYTGEPWKDDSEANRLNDRSTLALEASAPGRRFRFTVRFRDLDPFEVAAVLTALCPHQFREVLGGTDGYCSKLGYARPLGWGSVRIEARNMFLLNASGDKAVLAPVPDLHEWVRSRHRPTLTLASWLDVHRHKHPDAADYPRVDGQIYSYHTRLRADHSRARRYERTDG